jgi:hypothetical protein
MRSRRSASPSDVTVAWCRSLYAKDHPPHCLLPSIPCKQRQRPKNRSLLPCQLVLLCYRRNSNAGTIQPTAMERASAALAEQSSPLPGPTSNNDRDVEAERPQRLVLARIRPSLLPHRFTSSTLIWRHLPLPTKQESTQQQDAKLCTASRLPRRSEALTRCFGGGNDQQRLPRQRKTAQKRKQKQMRRRTHRSGLYGARPRCCRLHRPPPGRLRGKRTGEVPIPATVDRTPTSPIKLRWLSLLQNCDQRAEEKFLRRA